MKRILLVTVIGAAFALLAAGSATANDSLGQVAWAQAQVTPWHGYYYDINWGMPVALVVPPTATTQTNYSWGVGGTHVTPIYHQFHRNWPGPGVYDRRNFRPAPIWPSDTDQFGFYYVRGPW